MGSPSVQQLERHVRNSAADSRHVVFTEHSRLRMRQRRITDSMVLEVLRKGVMTMPPETDMRHPGLNCRMQRVVAGIEVAVVVHVEYPQTDLIVLTVMDVRNA